MPRRWQGATHTWSQRAPSALVDRMDDAAIDAGIDRSEWVRQACERDLARRPATGRWITIANDLGRAGVPSETIDALVRWVEDGGDEVPPAWVEMLTRWLANR